MPFSGKSEKAKIDFLAVVRESKIPEYYYSNVYNYDVKWNSLDHMQDQKDLCPIIKNKRLGYGATEIFDNIRFGGSVFENEKVTTTRENFKHFEYVKEYIDYLITYRMEKDIECMTLEGLQFLLKKFLIEKVKENIYNVDPKKVEILPEGNEDKTKQITTTEEKMISYAKQYCESLKQKLKYKNSHCDIVFCNDSIFLVTLYDMLKRENIKVSYTPDYLEDSGNIYIIINCESVNDLNFEPDNVTKILINR
jgi:hypothetical protein